MDDDQQFCLRWNNHQSTLISVFDTLLEKGIHVDCTLAAEGQTLKAHKVVLSACSPYFESVLSQQYDKHPIIILKDVKYAELRAMMDYMYRGEVNISQDQLAALLKAAESLQIKGLSDNKPPPRTSSPSLKGRVLETASTGHLHSREGSSSPAPRKRKKPRRASADSINISTEHIPSQNHTAIQPPVPIKNNIEHIENDVVVPIKVNKVSNDIVNDVIKINNKSEVADDAKIEFEEGNEDSVEDLTLDEEADSEIDSAHQISAGPSIGQGDVVQSFQWHMERSQDEVINTQDSQRDSQVAPYSSVYGPYILGYVSPNLKMVKNEFYGTAGYNHFYECVDCGNKYKHKGSLQRHIKYECRKQPSFKCPYCVYRAYQKHNLLLHERHLHKDLPEKVDYVE